MAAQPGASDLLRLKDIDRLVEAARAARIPPVKAPCSSCGETREWYVLVDGSPFDVTSEELAARGVLVQAFGKVPRGALCEKCAERLEAEG